MSEQGQKRVQQFDRALIISLTVALSIEGPSGKRGRALRGLKSVGANKGVSSSTHSPHLRVFVKMRVNPRHTYSTVKWRHLDTSFLAAWPIKWTRLASDSSNLRSFFARYVNIVFISPPWFFVGRRKKLLSPLLTGYAVWILK